MNGIEADILASLGVPASQPRFQWLEKDGWMFSNGGKWHFFRPINDGHLSLCRRHKLSGRQDLAREGHKAGDGACRECLEKYWRLVEAGELPRP